MLILIAVGIGFGFTYSLTGLANTAIVYSILWTIEKYSEAYFKCFENCAVFVFILCAAIAYMSYELNKNPEFVVNMFKSDFDEPEVAKDPVSASVATAEAVTSDSATKDIVADATKTTVKMLLGL